MAVGMRERFRRRARFLAFWLFAGAGVAVAQGRAAAGAWTSAVSRAFDLSPQARIVILDVATGRLLASTHLEEAARTVAAPGSTLKPLILDALVESGGWNPARRIACVRKLTVAGRSLTCVHPPQPPLDAEAALAWSCNSYFAALGGTLAPGQLRRLLDPTGLFAPTGLAAHEERGWLAGPASEDANKLAVLGVESLEVTPLELATAYRWLARQLAAHPQSAASQAVLAGLEDSTRFGMAAPAGQGGVSIAGKTGTASSRATAQSHGWFAGFAPAESPQVVIVIYLPAGHGMDAARVAAELLAHSPLRGAP